MKNDFEKKIVHIVILVSINEGCLFVLFVTLKSPKPLWPLLCFGYYWKVLDFDE